MASRICMKHGSATRELDLLKIVMFLSYMCHIWSQTHIYSITGKLQTPEFEGLIHSLWSSGQVPGYRSIGPGSIPGSTRFSEK
jgi:hypothetical protein